ncbi:hypothetical protein O3M35_006543 [Rhynocoris fuscipes]|uniref:Uncharacterized protein n=1 Tax=Rhynocoris fuscipes TaxID=488301 RepID=A0AAW1DL51_9HEMI
MKFRGANTLPPSIALWLEQQLELRGIDSVIYSRYIISLLNDETFDLNDHKKGNKKLTSWKSCNLEELKRSAVIQCLTEAADQAFEIEKLVDELCTKIKEAEIEEDKCLKEKNNSENVFNFNSQVSSLDLASRYYSAFPALTKGSSLENTFPLTSVWSRSICRALGGGRKRGDSESSPKDNKISKRKENKENVLCGGVSGGLRRMRSRSTVKQSSGHHYRSRALAAKSLDRKEDEINAAMKRTYGAIKTMSGADLGPTEASNVNDDFGSGMGDPRGKKCLNFNQNSLGQLIGFPLSSGATFEEMLPSHRDEKLSRTPGRKFIGGGNNDNCGKIGDQYNAEYYDSADLPVDFQQLLTSPSDISAESSLYKLPQSLSSGCSGAPSGNFIQCGTNITSSIWSDTSEKMEEDESGGSSGNWENACNNNGGIPSGGNSKWSDARSSILSSAWKLPFVYDKDIEGTSLAVNASSGSFFSFFDANTNPALFLNSSDKNVSKVEGNKVGGVDNDSLRSNGCEGGERDDEEEEDLLTSMKTHFRPIKNNDNSCRTDGQASDGGMVGISVGTATGAYKDGSTFSDTSASPVKLDYKRSESGALYLVTTGEKYFEFKRSTPNYLMNLSSQQPQEYSSSSETFVPKFKVRQNEKFCQTDSPSTELESDFFFPGDDRLAEETVSGCYDYDDVEDVVSEETEDSGDWFEGRRNFEDQPRQTIQVSGWVTAWPVTSMDSNTAIWASVGDSNNAKAWMFGKSGNAVCNVVEGGTVHLEDCRMDDRNEDYLRLKDELSEEGEELLSDLSSIHLFLDPERMEDPHPNLQKALTVESGGI